MAIRSVGNGCFTPVIRDAILSVEISGFLVAANDVVVAGLIHA